jgi:hypothetical protein
LLGALAVPLVSLGCSADPYVTLADWNLSTADGRSSQIHAPQRLDQLLPRSPGTYWLDTDVTLPPALRGRALTLTWADTHALATLLVDGQSIDPLSLTPFDRVRPSRKELVFRLPETATKRAGVHLRLQVAHVAPWTARIGMPLRLSPGPDGEHQLHLAAEVNYAFVVAALAVIALLVVASGVSFLVDRRRVAAGWYALMNLGFFVSCATGLGFAQLLVPNDIRRTPLLAVPLVCISGAAFTHAQFRLKPPRRVCLVVALLAIVGLALGWPTFATPGRYLLCLFLQLTSVAVFELLTVGRLIRTPEWRWQAVVNLASMGMLAGGVLLEIPLHLIDVLPLACIACTCALGVTLLRLHTVGLRAIDVTLADHTSMLEDRTREVGQLDKELQLQALHRPDRLAEAVARLRRLSTQREPVPAGAILGARYKVLTASGWDRGGAVYEVERILDGRRLTLKPLRFDGDDWPLAQGGREVHLPPIAHPNVVGVLDVDVDSSGLPYVVTELVKGEPLATEQARFGDPIFAHEVVRQAARGLAALHDVGIVHGNLTPAKVLLERSDDHNFRVKIFDFDLRRLLRMGRLSGSSTVVNPAPAGVLSTDGFIPFVLGDTRDDDDPAPPVYSAPELSTGSVEADPACDLWSLGVVAYELGCGRLPSFASPADHPGEAARQPGVDLGPLVGPLRRVVERCLDLDPRRRPSAAEVVAVLA